MILIETDDDPNQIWAQHSKKTTEEEERQSGKGWAQTDVFFFEWKVFNRDVFGWSVSSENPKRSYEMKWLKRQNPFQIHAQVNGLLGMFWGPVIPTKIRCPRKPSGYVGWLLRYSNIYSIPQYLGKFSQKWLFCNNPRLHPPYGRVSWTCMISRGVTFWVLKMTPCLRGQDCQGWRIQCCHVMFQPFFFFRGQFFRKLTSLKFSGIKIQIAERSKNEVQEEREVTPTELQIPLLFGGMTGGPKEPKEPTRNSPFTSAGMTGRS